MVQSSHGVLSALPHNSAGTYAFQIRIISRCHLGYLFIDHSKHFILQGLVTDWSLRFVLVRKDINAFRIMLICITDCLSNQLCQLPADRFFISSCFRLVYDNHILTVMFIKAVFPQGQRVGNSGSKHLVMIIALAICSSIFTIWAFSLFSSLSE